MDKLKDSCEICRKKFGGVFTVEHMCKRCLRSICRECCTKKKNMFVKASSKIEEHRCCDLCLPDSEMVMNYIKDHQLVFNGQSKEGKEWAELADIHLEDDNSFNRSRSVRIKVDSISFMDVWTQMTPSLRELTGLLTAKMTTGTIDSILKSTSERLTFSSNLDLTAGLIIYLLCHSDEKTCSRIFNYLSTISHSISQKQIVANIEILWSKGETPMDAKGLKIMTNFAKSAYKSLILAYFANSVTIDVLHYVVLETLLCGNAVFLELVASCLIFECRVAILAGKSDEKGLRNYMWQTVSLKNLEKSVKKLRKLTKKESNTQPTETPQHIPKSSPQPQPLQFSKKSLTVEQKPIKQFSEPTQSQKKMEQQIIGQLNQVALFMKRIEEKEEVDDNVQLTDLDSLDKYLDFVIQENDCSLKEFQELQKMLLKMENQLQKQPI